MFPCVYYDSSPFILLVSWASQNTVLKALTGTIWQQKKIKGIQIGKEVIKLSLFTDDMIVQIRDPKTLAKKILEMIKKNSV